jgi:hypothetical protein
LEVGINVLNLTYCLIVMFCAKYFQNPLIYEEFMDGTQKYSVTDNVYLWPPKETLTLEVDGRSLRACHIVSLLWTIVASIYKIRSMIRKLWTGHDIYPQIDNVDLEWANATLTLEVGVWLLRMTHRLIRTNICAKLSKFLS